jgi:hypothetical protein
MKNEKSIEDLLKSLKETIEEKDNIINLGPPIKHNDFDAKATNFVSELVTDCMKRILLENNLLESTLQNLLNTSPEFQDMMAEVFIQEFQKNETAQKIFEKIIRENFGKINNK